MQYTILLQLNFGVTPHHVQTKNMTKTCKKAVANTHNRKFVGFNILLVQKCKKKIFVIDFLFPWPTELQKKDCSSLKH